MSEPSFFESIRINASSGSTERPRAAHTGVLCGKLTELFADVIEDELHIPIERTPSDRPTNGEAQWIRNYYRIPFLDKLFRDADYGVWKRQGRVTSAAELTFGEVMAVMGWAESEGAYEELAQYLNGG